MKTASQDKPTESATPEVATIDDGLLITVKEARKILGKQAKDLSDKHLSEMILGMETLAQDIVIKNVVPQIKKV